MMACLHNSVSESYFILTHICLVILVAFFLSINNYRNEPRMEFSFLKECVSKQSNELNSTKFPLEGLTIFEISPSTKLEFDGIGSSSSLCSVDMDLSSHNKTPIVLNVSTPTVSLLNKV